ncbi:hypothetical protein [Labrys monachus]|uniref:Uncharacterized protein n=1 Tax=Labrys monachus TaxID=217067 RepID=A0ABU0FC99_9HYPH|nr:hypothetical protein [Labrys monachus]MDQ0392239.1 hypothetical protein [Labrys monachus]
MAKSHQKWLGDRARVKALVAKRAEGAAACCTVWGCKRLPQAAARKGLSTFICRYHAQYHNRHGSYYKGTYRAAELLPYKRAALRYIRDHKADKGLLAAKSALDGIMQRAGPVQRMSDIMVMPAADKARAALARMRDAGVPADRLLLVYLTVCATITDDSVGPGGDREVFRQTQIGKAAHRLASGYHTDYGYERYPRSAGLAIRHLGQMIEKACEWVGAGCVAAVVVMAETSREGPRAASKPRQAAQGATRGR